MKNGNKKIKKNSLLRECSLPAIFGSIYKMFPIPPYLLKQILSALSPPSLTPCLSHQPYPLCHLGDTLSSSRGMCLFNPFPNASAAHINISVLSPPHRLSALPSDASSLAPEIASRLPLRILSCHFTFFLLFPFKTTSVFFPPVWKTLFHF